MRSILAFTLTAFLLFSACTKTTTEAYSFNPAAYYPYAVENIRDYDLDSFSYDWSTGDLIQFHFMVRERVVGKFVDLSGKEALRVEQFISRDSGRSYEVYAVHTINVDETGMQRVEDNQRYLKMVSPVVKRKKWDGNLYNNLGYREYQYYAVKAPFSNNFKEYADCVHVMQQNDSSFIAQEKKMEIYAASTGLVYKMEKNVTFDQVTDKVEGYILEWNLRNYWEK